MHGVSRQLIHVVSYFDHATWQGSRGLQILLNKQTEDAHDNPVLTLDGEGYSVDLLECPRHGAAGLHPPQCEALLDRCQFEHVLTTNFSYAHAWHVPGSGLFLPHTRYEKGGRSLYWMTSKTGAEVERAADCWHGSRRGTIRSPVSVAARIASVVQLSSGAGWAERAHKSVLRRDIGLRAYLANGRRGAAEGPPHGSRRHRACARL